MEPVKTRIRINLNTREVEWEGSEIFINKYDSLINEFLTKMKDEPLANTYQKNSANSSTNRLGVTSSEPETNTNGIPESFGEYYTAFPRNIKVVEKILIAAYFIQQKSQDGLFTIKEASDILNEQNVPISNPNAFIKSLGNTGKLYKNSGKYKVSEKGIEMIKQLGAQVL